MTQLPKIIKTNSSVKQTFTVDIMDEYGDMQTKEIACEHPLTVYLNWIEIVTLMTLGERPSALVLGYLKNQGFIEDIDAIESVIIDWDTNSAAVITKENTDGVSKTLEKKTVTSGCGQGTMYGNVMKKLEGVTLPQPQISQAKLYQLLEALTHHNETYKAAGAVHGCAVCKDTEILSFVEDVGRHNAVDTLAGEMWLKGETGNDKIFYTTGRLTSEMVIKVAQMGIPVLLSRSGATQMGYELAQKLGITMIARAKGHRFQVYSGMDNLILDVKGNAMSDTEQKQQEKMTPNKGQSDNLL
ncbi:TPA: formate dehydrogenase accessory sulfurtransferase FdhD [Photobacterium damselae]|uniref:Formate dehydrogenase accessory sulfurtransferase FdhD n=1 Tax=Photobacterium damselae TaxID=38293 RepID=A0ACD3T6E5_PHODM|nr:formate dehydrogenase accessory sulfurtransferase FdhD [Photobacterium damselae]MBA5682168.1 formate dehydrogenase accessory sulfurtransferase FdhD [Photobacterium damselae subsp. damselae]MCG3824424.1 formate dehydrogenase accessory sulfurtransferase FdhD [Photobacterium damselae]NVH52422.1 formate dehydrogenase accessory sulfurtransferase FdhD [Photobacterium damselae subsp. damselae]NVO81536.1 formate dehydrogenase accessory sulfurtransferase FdhD [Photobacterium damselae subsp. damselae]